MQEVNILDFVKSGTIMLGREVNSNRALPLVNDGLRTVYRRAIYTALGYNHDVKTATISGKIIGELHPHGLDSVDKALNNLARLGIFNGDANFGQKGIETDIDAASTRYTETGISKKYRDLIEPLMSYVPFIDGELDGFREPQYLPTPIPLAFQFPIIGLGVGVNCRIPAFEMSSLVDAMVSDDPMKLKAPYGLEIDYDNSELWSLWNTGLGKVTYKYHVDIENHSGDNLIVIHAGFGAPEVFKPNVSVFQKYIDSGKMFSIDLTDGSRAAYGLGKNTRVAVENFDQCLELAKQISTNSKTYRLTVSDSEGHSYCIPMKEWLKECYTNYISLVNKMRDDKLAKAQFNKQVFEMLPQVGKLIVNNPDITDNEILKQVKGLTEQVLKVILSKSISQLRKGDTSKEVAKYDEEIKKWTNFDAVKYTEDVMHKL